jgi:hypothetical protein
VKARLSSSSGLIRDSIIPSRTFSKLRLFRTSKPSFPTRPARCTRFSTARKHPYIPHISCYLAHYWTKPSTWVIEGMSLFGRPWKGWVIMRCGGGGMGLTSCRMMRNGVEESDFGQGEGYAPASCGHCNHIVVFMHGLFDASFLQHRLVTGWVPRRNQSLLPKLR